MPTTERELVHQGVTSIVAWIDLIFSAVWLIFCITTLVRNPTGEDIQLKPEFAKGLADLVIILGCQNNLLWIWIVRYVWEFISLFIAAKLLQSTVVSEENGVDPQTKEWCHVWLISDLAWIIFHIVGTIMSLMDTGDGVLTVQIIITARIVAFYFVCNYMKEITSCLNNQNGNLESVEIGTTLED